MRARNVNHYTIPDMWWFMEMLLRIAVYMADGVWAPQTVESNSALDVAAGDFEAHLRIRLGGL